MTVSGVGIQPLSTLHPITDEQGISTAALDAMTLARAHGLDADAVERLGVVVTAMAGNILRHAQTGQVILRQVGEHGLGCIEVLALDKGPGIADMTRTMRDSATPAGGIPRATPAAGVLRDGGLADIRRLADLFDIYSHTGCGTALVAHVGTPATHDDASCTAESVRHGTVGVVCVPLQGEQECGDSWAVDISDARMTVLLVDGLGHGPGAAIAARAAMAVFRDVSGDKPESILTAMHAALRHTRGAALSVSVVDHASGSVHFCGVGNVDGRVVNVDASKHMAPQNGIVGHTMPRPQCASVPWPADGRLVMHSDGITARWKADSYPGLLARHPSLLAGVLFRDFARARDDATVVVLRNALPAVPA